MNHTTLLPITSTPVSRTLKAGTTFYPTLSHQRNLHLTLTMTTMTRTKIRIATDIYIK